jgi:hypothetical protein
MNPIALCKSCGEAFELDEMVDEVCMKCSEYYENSERVPLDFDQLYTNIDKEIGDCV